MKWIFTADKRAQYYDLDAALRQLPCINWGMNNYLVEPGDIIYLYEAHPESYIRYKCIVEETKVWDHKYDESLYGGWHKGDLTDGRDMRISLDYEFKEPITLKMLAEHGLSAKRISVTKSENKPEVFDWLNEYEDLDRAGLTTPEEPDDLDPSTEEVPLLGKEHIVEIKQRENQSKFRDLMIKRYGACALCGNDAVVVLNASHIKPWKDSDEVERLDPDNGFLLCPCHDRAFDLGLISFDEDGKIMISEKLSEKNRELINLSEDQEIELTDGNKQYLEYHRDYVFKG